MSYRLTCRARWMSAATLCVLAALAVHAQRAADPDRWEPAIKAFEAHMTPEGYEIWGRLVRPHLN